MNRPRLLDLFCCAGGAAMGYYRAGFDVVGVDIRPQPRYPFMFIQGDALEYCRENGTSFDAIHASPPCQGYSRTRHLPGVTHEGGAVEECRAALVATGRPFVIENVPGAPLREPITLCGTMFGLRVIRHRLFETWPRLTFVPATCGHVGGTGAKRVGGAAYYSHPSDAYVTVAGHLFSRAAGSEAMGIEWMSRAELAQAIPPAYTEWIGRQLMAECAVPA